VESREVQQINGVGGLTMDGDNEPMDGARRAEDRTRGEGRWLPGPIHYPPTGTHRRFLRDPLSLSL
jgi:DNA-binding transcriptional regulator LsrR (DeoR family)